MPDRTNKKETEETKEKTEKLAVSACLIGERCRYDGIIIKNDKVLELAGKFELIPFCPEVLGGLPTPRPPAEIEFGDGFNVLDGKSKIIDIAGRDVTANFIKGAEKTLQILEKHKVQRVLLKSKSPSCGLTCIIRKNQKIKGLGVTAALLRQNGLALEEFE